MNRRPGEVTIQRVSNGWVVCTPDEVTAVEDLEDHDGGVYLNSGCGIELEAFRRMLIYVMEKYGVYYSKNNPVNMKIDIIHEER